MISLLLRSSFSCAGQRIVRDIRKSLFSSIMRKEVAFFDRTRTGELVNRLSADTLMVGEALTTNIADGLRSCVQVAGGVGMMVRNRSGHDPSGFCQREGKC